MDSCAHRRPSQIDATLPNRSMNQIQISNISPPRETSSKLSKFFAIFFFFLEILNTFKGTYVFSFSNLAKRNVYRKKKERRIREIETVEWRITREFHCRRGEEHAPKVKSRSKRSVASRRKNEHTKRYTDNHTRSHECTTFFQSVGSFRRRRNHRGQRR